MSYLKKYLMKIHLPSLEVFAFLNEAFLNKDIGFQTVLCFSNDDHILINNFEIVQYKNCFHIYFVRLKNLSTMHNNA
jgi:hypothetical protein